MSSPFIKNILLVLLFIGLGLGIGGGLFYLQHGSSKSATAEEASPSASSSPTSTVSANKRTFSDASAHVSFSFPDSLIAEADTLQGVVDPIYGRSVRLLTKKEVGVYVPTGLSLYILQQDLPTTSLLTTAVSKQKKAALGSFQVDPSFPQETASGFLHGRYVSGQLTADLYEQQSNGVDVIILARDLTGLKDADIASLLASFSFPGTASSSGGSSPSASSTSQSVRGSSPLLNQ